MTLVTDLDKISNHLAITSSKEIADMMLPQLNKHGITVFNFYREYADGSFIRLSSHREWAERYFKKGYANKLHKIPSAYITKPVNYFVWLTKDYPEMLIDAATNFDISNGVSIVHRHKDYIDFFGFGSSRNNFSIINFYINNLDLLQKYSSYFTEQSKSLITSSEKDKLILVNPTEQNRNEANSPSNLIFNKVSTPQIKLSNRQYHCAKLLILGKTYKEIATAFNLSVRTVEDYVEQLKIKFGCRNKSELIIKLVETDRM